MSLRRTPSMAEQARLYPASPGFPKRLARSSWCAQALWLGIAFFPQCPAKRAPNFVWLLLSCACTFSMKAVNGLRKQRAGASGLVLSPAMQTKP